MSVTFNPGDKVLYNGLYGIINTIVGSIALVDFENNTVKKVPISDLCQVSESETETIEKTEITITPEQFRNIAINELKKRTLDGSIMNLGFTGFIIELHKALFFGSVSEKSEIE